MKATEVNLSTVNYRDIPNADKLSVAIASCMFVTELAYEVAKRWIPILRTNRNVFHHDARMALRRFEESVKQYNCWVTRATGSAEYMNIVRSISDELNEYADDELHKLMLTVKNSFDRQHVTESMTLARLETLYYIFVLANINATENLEMATGLHPNIRRFKPMKLEDQLRIIQGIRCYVIEVHAPHLEMTEEMQLQIEHGIYAIITQIMKHCNEVLASHNTEPLTGNTDNKKKGEEKR